MELEERSELTYLPVSCKKKRKKENAFSCSFALHRQQQQQHMIHPVSIESKWKSKVNTVQATALNHSNDLVDGCPSCAPLSEPLCTPPPFILTQSQAKIAVK